MKSKWTTALLCGMLTTFFGLGRCRAQPTLGIPEPGLLMFGSITNTAGVAPSPVASVTWLISGGNPPELVTVQATAVTVNGQPFYVARVPFETRSIGTVDLGRTPNVFGLSRIPTAYTRAVRVNGTNATVVLSSRNMLVNFTFGATNRGLTERVDLQVSLPGQPDVDSDGDGMSDWSELIAGTDPMDPNSVFKASTDIQPSPGGGLTIKWSSVAGKIYSIHRTTDVGQPFTTLSTNLPATPPQNQFTDTTATGAGPYFYRVKVGE